MKSSVILSMCLVMTTYFANQVAPLPQNLGAFKNECDCQDASHCVGTKSCSCVTGTCTSETCDKFEFLVQAREPDSPQICDCGDGSHCTGKTCHCDEETNACIAENDSNDAPTEDPTEDPTEAPTEAATEAVTEAPTDAPTEAPTEAPIEVSTEAPTEDPEEPTEAPTEAPIEDNTTEGGCAN